MKKTVLSIWLLFACFMVNSTPPIENGKEKSVENYLFLPSAKLNLDDDFIYPGRGFYFNLSTGISNIRNSNLSSKIWNSNAGIGYSLNLGYFHSVSPWFKIKTGFGLSTYKNTLKVDGIAPFQTFSDIDNDTYIETLSLNNIEKKTSPIYVSVPFIFEFGNPNIDKPGFYVDLGIKYSFLLNESFKQSGSYSAKGTYEPWNVTLENVPELGFYNEKEPTANTTLKNSNISLVAGAGVFIPFSREIIFKGGIVTDFGFTDIGNNKTENMNQNVINDEIYSYRARYIDNSLAVEKGSKTIYIGLEFGIYICLGLK